MNASNDEEKTNKVGTQSKKTDPKRSVRKSMKHHENKQSIKLSKKQLKKLKTTKV